MRSFIAAALLGGLGFGTAAQAQPPPPPLPYPAPGAAVGPEPAVGPAFWQSQLRYPTVRAAQAAAGPRVAGLLRTHGLDAADVELFFRLIKTRRTLEVWARAHRAAGPFALLKNYPLAATSGTLGPKRRAGDGQTPEGCYAINRYNPASAYHLSLGLDYPRPADRALGAPDPGGDIFIHGSNVTVGCLPLTDAGIEEVYLLAVAARASGQARIAVHIFPFPLTEAELARRAASPHAAFWRSLQPEWAAFEQQHELLSVDGCPLIVVR